MAVSSWVDIVIDLTIQVLGDDAVTDTHLEMCTNIAAGKDCGIFRLNSPYLDIRILSLEGFADTADGAPRTDT